MTLGRRFEDMCRNVLQGENVWFRSFIQRSRGYKYWSNYAMKRNMIGFVVLMIMFMHLVRCSLIWSNEWTFGKSTGCSKGRGGSMNLFSREHTYSEDMHLLERIPVALGAAFSSKYKKEVAGNSNSNSVTAAFFGDGTCTTGSFLNA